MGRRCPSGPRLTGGRRTSRARGRGQGGRRERGASAAVRCLAWPDVFSGPVSFVRAVAPEHPAGHGGLVHLVDAVGDAHGGCRRTHGLDRREIGSTDRAQDVQRVLARRRSGAIFSCTISCPAMRMPCDPTPGGGAEHYEHAVDAHHEQQSGDPPRRDEPLLAVDDPLIAVSFGTGLEQVRIAAAPVGFLLNSGPTEKSHALAQRVTGGLRQDGPAPGRTRVRVLGRRQEPAGEAVVSHMLVQATGPHANADASRPS